MNITYKYTLEKMLILVYVIVWKSMRVTYSHRSWIFLGSAIFTSHKCIQFRGSGFLGGTLEKQYFFLEIEQATMPFQRVVLGWCTSGWFWWKIMKYCLKSIFIFEYFAVLYGVRLVKLIKFPGFPFSFSNNKRNLIKNTLSGPIDEIACFFLHFSKRYIKIDN